jgi:ABC-2 type transport system permease protein
VVAGLGIGVTAGVVLGDAGEVPRLLAASLAYLPAVFVVIGVAVLLVGVRPQSSIAVWGLWAFCLVLSFFGTLLHVPGAVFDLSSFEHVPLVPAVPVQWVPLAVLAGVAVVTTGVGMRALQRRDIG